LGRIEIELPPQEGTPLWYTIADDAGIVVQGSGGGYAEIEVQGSGGGYAEIGVQVSHTAT
ncbi:hypothetical protein T484DRAFT_1862549, partial [Baffinella frigidus]